MAMAAMVSVVETTAPSAQPIRQSKPGNNHSERTATPATVNPTRPKANMEILSRFERKSRHEVLKAPEKTSGGRNTRKTRCGLSEMCGALGNNDSTRPPITSTIG